MQAGKVTNIARELCRGVSGDLNPRNRFQFIRGVARANYEYLTHRPTIPTVELLDLVPEAADDYIDLRYRPSWWNIDANSLVALTVLARTADAKLIFEFGTYKGVTARQLAESCPEAEVVTLDLPASLGSHFVPGEFFHGSDAASRITQEYGDSKSFDFSRYFGTMDVVFVDAGHEYEDACADSHTALGLVRDGGTIVWDDYTSWTGVRRCVNEFARDLPILHVAGTRLAVLQR